MSIKYQIASGTNQNQVETLVEDLIKQGWRCQGGISVAMAPNKYITEKQYAQAMIFDGFKYPQRTDKKP
jgi:hypothetical protein